MQVPRFTVDLALPPQQRWSAVTAAYGHHFGPLTRRIEQDFIGPALNALPLRLGHILYHFLIAFLGLVCWLDRRSWIISYAQELVGIARGSGVPIGKVRSLAPPYHSNCSFNHAAWVCVCVCVPFPLQVVVLQFLYEACKSPPPPTSPCPRTRRVGTRHCAHPLRRRVHRGVLLLGGA